MTRQKLGLRPVIIDVVFDPLQPYQDGPQGPGRAARYTGVEYTAVIQATVL